jgi:LmbE family N-acetylglucosaminyl deacetylase
MMKLTNPAAEIFVPDGVAIEKALSRTTHLGIGAHQDDLEFMALHGILDCYQNKDKWFSGITVTDGAGSSRANEYSAYTDEKMKKVRRREQNKAAELGEYGAMISLDYPSSRIKVPHCRELIEELKQLIPACHPDYIYTHNLADKHDTHLAVVIPVITALRELPTKDHPKAVYGCEVWRNLDWINDSEKIVFDVSARENLSMALMGLFDSQITGGKRYDLATYGRKKANATYFSSHATDQARLLEFAMDLTPLIQNPKLDISDYVINFIHRFEKDVAARVAKFTKK